MKPFPEYKESGIEWLGRIPKHWNTNKFCRVSYMKGRIGWQGLKQSEFVDDVSLPYLITGMNFKNGFINWEEVYHITEERYAEAPEIQLQKDDVLMTKDGTIGKLLYVDHLPNKASLNSHLLVLRPLNREYIPRFLYYELQSEHFKIHIEQVKTGTTFYGITQEGTGQFKVLLPPILEQSQIATFLDYKTHQIDDLIEKKQKLIELLKEERLALINNSVTKGLDPRVPMKDSGIDWLGEIPIHWRKEKIVRIGDIKGRIGWRGYTVNDLRPEGEGVLVLGATQINKLNRIDLTSRTYISIEKFEESPDIKLYGGEILFVKVGATIGKVAIVPDNIGEATINPNVMIFRNFKFATNEFLYYYFNSDPFLAALDVAKSAGAQDAINQELIKSLWLPLPPIEEQEMISSYIAENLSRIDNSIELIVAQIELISEYKTTLISEAVTGKIDVRDYQINHA